MKNANELPAEEIPENISKRKYIKKYASPVFYKSWKILGLVGYLLYPILFVLQFWFYDTQLERLIYLGLLLATHLGKNKVCSIILIAFGGLFTIAGFVILRVGATGFAAIGIGVAALILLNGAEKEYFNWKRNK